MNGETFLINIFSPTNKNSNIVQKNIFLFVKEMNEYMYNNRQLHVNDRVGI